MMTPVDKILGLAQKGADLRLEFFSKEAVRVDAAALYMAHALATGKKIMLCGNGGSAADSQHIAAEFVNRFHLDRPPLPALALTTDTSIITSIGNDFSYDEIFSKQILALGNAGDCLIALSTSGTSKNILLAATAARKKGVFCIGLAGKDGGAMPEACNSVFIVREESTALVQEVHIAIGHALCGLVDYYLFENVAELTPYLEGKRPLPIF